MEPKIEVKKERKQRLVLSVFEIKKIVKEVEAGFSQKAAVAKYGMCRAALSSWMNKFGSPEYKAQRQRSYSVVQKRSAVRALESGMTSSQAANAWDIRDSSLIRQWKAIFDRENADISSIDPAIMPHKKPVESDSEEVRALKKALTVSQMQNKALNTLIDVAEETLKIDIRKKPGAKQSFK